MSKIKVDIKGMQTGESKQIVIDGITHLQAVKAIMAMLGADSGCQTKAQQNSGMTSDN